MPGGGTPGGPGRPGGGGGGFSMPGSGGGGFTMPAPRVGGGGGGGIPGIIPGSPSPFDAARPGACRDMAALAYSGGRTIPLHELALFSRAHGS